MTAINQALSRAKNLLRTATSFNASPKRIVSKAANRVAYRRSLPMAPAGPSSLYFEVTNACNLECKICPTGIHTTGRKKARMPLDQYKRILDDNRASLMRAVYAGYGEPFLNPDIFEMLDYGRQLKIFTEVYSNMLLVKDEHLERIVDVELSLLVVAIDLAPKDDNWRFTETTTDDISLCKDRLKKLHEIKLRRGAKTPSVRVSYPMTKKNEQFEAEAREFAREVGADNFLPKTVNATVAGKSFGDMRNEWVAEKFDRYNDRTGAGHCKWPYSSGLVYANGDLAPCCHLGRGEHVFGNVFDDGFGGVWNNEKMQDFRHRLGTNPDAIPVCGDCAERFGSI